MRAPIRGIAAIAAGLAGIVSVLAMPLAGQQPQGGPLLEARITRVEQGLLPGVVIAGAPPAPMRLSERMAHYATPGVSVAVVNNGVIEWARGYGVAEAGGSTSVTPHTRFQAASISKSVASLGLQLLAAERHISLDEPANLRLVSWKVPDNDLTAKQPVTLRRLLSHTAGLTVHGFGGYEAGRPVPTLVQVLDGVKPANSAPVRVDVLPGSVNRYSGGGYTVAQQWMNDVGGKPFPSMMADLVLRPVGMTESTYEQPLPDRLRGEAASGHGGDGKPIPGRYHTYPELAAAGLWTTPTDLATFLIEIQRALAGRSKVIPVAMAREMTTRQIGDYGLGLSVEGTGPSTWFGHGGSNEGFRCQMAAFTAGGSGAVVMTNGDRGGALAAELLRAVAREYGWPAWLPQEKRVVSVDSRVLSGLEGSYELAPGHVLVMRLEGGTLFVYDGAKRAELFPESATTFFDTVENHAFEFVRDAGGAVTHVVIDGTLRIRRM